MPLRVLIAGGGIAAGEGLLALHALAGDRVSVTILAPERELVYRPRAVLEPFRLGKVGGYPLGKIAAEHGAHQHADGLAEVDIGAHRVRTDRGTELPFDALMIAVGARAVPGLSGAFTFRAEEPEALNAVLGEIDRGAARRIAFVVPPKVVWTLPLYELAFMTASHAASHSIKDIELILVTPEETPLHLFGRRASEAVQALLDRHSITVCTASYVEGFENGSLTLRPGGRRIEADRVIALPNLEGPRIVGLPSDPGGFIPIDRHCRVLGAEDVYAAGDATSFPVKQGGIATQQADAAAEVIAARAGAPVEPSEFRAVLRGMLFMHGEPEYLRAAISGGEGETSIASSHALWLPSAKVAGRYLTPYLARLDSRTHGLLREDAEGVLPIDVQLVDLLDERPKLEG